MIGAVGSDIFGQQLLASLHSHGVDTAAVAVKEGASGMAFITVDEQGENHIIVSEGANSRLSPSDIDRVIETMRPGAILLQNEIPWETNFYAMKKAKERGIRLFFNPAPAFAIPQEAFSLIDVCILNETEAETMTGRSVRSLEQAEHAARMMVAGGIRCVILTLGERGSVLLNQAGQHIVTPAYKVTPADTTAAGDTFIGAFAAASLSSSSLTDALRFASAAAAIAVTRKGAQTSIPTKEEIDRFMLENWEFF
jgi:ribokinase